MTPSPRRPIWGWTPPRRRALVGLAAIPALWLLAGLEPDAPSRPAPDLLIDPNTAPPGVLAALPGLGPARVGRIVEARQARPFQSPDELDPRVEGIGPVTLDGLRPFLRVDPPAPAGSLAR